MFYFFLLVFATFYLTCQVIAEYKLKAIKAGEADLSLLEKNKLFMCHTCKFCAATTFIIMIFSGLILIFAPPGEVAYVTNWGLLGFSKPTWEVIHTIVSIVFVASFSFHIYVHWKSAVNALKKLFGK